MCCRQNWEEARGLLKGGVLRTFLLALGRSDLAQAVDHAAGHTDLDLGLDDFLARLPGCQPAPPRLEIERAEIDLGTIARGQDRTFTLTIKNTGERLLSGAVRSVDCLWLGVSEPHLNEQRFQASAGEQLEIQLHTRGKELRTGPHKQEGEVKVVSNGGVRSLLVRIHVPVTPYPDGELKGAQTPKQLAEKGRAAPAEMARLLEDGSVARWYQCNGWAYPVTGPRATGLASVQQYFEVLGLTTPTRVELHTTVVNLQGAAGGKTQGRLVLSTSEKRPIYAHAQADQTWLSVGPTEYRGNQAIVPLSVAVVPSCAGQTLRAELSVQANGEQRFKVPVSLQVGPPAAGKVEPRGLTGFHSPDWLDDVRSAEAQPRGLTGFHLPPLSDASLPPLPNQPAQGPSVEAIPLAQARVDSAGARSRRRLSCVCLLLSFLLLSSSAALVAWKLLKTDPEATPPPPQSKPSAAAIVHG